MLLNEVPAETETNVITEPSTIGEVSRLDFHFPRMLAAEKPAESRRKFRQVCYVLSVLPRF
jgi:hypothetical protein